MTWSHPRGFDPMVACATEFSLANPSTVIDWDARSLQDFADFPLSELTDKYDLLVFDHPFIGEIAESGLLLPLDNLIDSEFLANQRAASVGLSCGSYEWGGHQWALAIDAACQVSAWRPDLLEGKTPPRSWEEVIRLARSSSTGPRVAFPLAPIDSYICFLTLLANSTAEPFVDGTLADLGLAAESLERLAELLSLCDPRSTLWNPINLLEVMSTTHEVSYSPLIFGYSNYSRTGFRENLVRFGTIPRGIRGAAGGVLGGAGIGVSAKTQHPDAAAQFARYVASGEVQSSTYAEAGGQPGHRSAWMSPSVNTLSNGFFLDTFEGIETSYLRPRDPGYLQRQTEAGERVHEWLTSRSGTAHELATQLAVLLKGNPT